MKVGRWVLVKMQINMLGSCTGTGNPENLPRFGFIFLPLLSFSCSPIPQPLQLWSFYPLTSQGFQQLPHCWVAPRKTLKTGDFLRCSQELLPNWIEENFIWAEGKMSSVALRNNCSTRELRTAKKYRTLAKKREWLWEQALLGDVNKVNSLLLCFTVVLGEGMICWAGWQGCPCALVSSHSSGE